MKTFWLSMALLAGCTKNEGTDSASSSDTEIVTDDTAGPLPDPEWSLLADELGNGALLSGWTDQGITHMVGGDMHGGPGLRVAFDGQDLCIEADITERALWWIHGDRDGRWAAVGEAGTVLLEEDGTRTRMDIPSEANFYGVWVTADTMVAVGGHVGGLGEIWKHEAGEWTAIATDLPGVAFKIWEDWVVGVDISYRLSADGTLTDLGAAGRLLTARGDGDKVWAVGGIASALVMVHDGSSWTEVDSAGLGQPMNGVWTAPGEDVWVAGNFGTTGVLRSSGWEMPDWPVTSHHFHAVWPHAPGEMLFIGGNFMSTADNFATIGRYGPGTVTPEVSPCD